MSEPLHRIVPYERQFARHSKSVYWYQENNGDITPEMVYISSKNKYWFYCDTCNHTFYASLNKINNNCWCPYCCTNSITLCDDEHCASCYHKSFASHPKVIFWNSTKNGTVTPRDKFRNANTKFWFNCDTCEHTFDMSLNNLTYGGKWCPYCAHCELCDDEHCASCYQNSFASHPKAQFWYVEKNGTITPRDKFRNANAGTKFWFYCDTCDHTFKTSLNDVNSGCWCPYCAHCELCDDAYCTACYNNSFASHPKVIYWNSIKNGDINPRKVFKYSNKIYWLYCNSCEHTYDTILSNLTLNESGCSYCGIQGNIKLCEDINCESCFNKSLASCPEIVRKYDVKNTKNLRQIFKSTSSINQKIWLKCDTCPHSYNTTGATIQRGCGCPYCSVPCKEICDDDDCDFCYQHSYASHPTSINWSKKNGNIKPRDCIKKSNKKYWFDCDNCKDPYLCALNNRCAGKSCPICKRKTEKKMHDALKERHPDIVREFKQEWCKNINCLPFDFCILGLKIIIELDGRQHLLIQVSNWGDPESIHERDVYKQKCAKNNGYHTIRILQEDVLYDKNKWLDKLLLEIEYIKNNQGSIHHRYICDNNEYDIFPQ